MTYKIEKTDAQWQALLAEKGAEPKAFEVTRHEATERAFTGRLADNKAAGTYTCICCDKPLFGADAKFDSGPAGRVISSRSRPMLWAPRPTACCG